MPLISIHNFANGGIPFLWLNNIPLCMYVCIPHLYPSIHRRHVGCFYALTIVNYAAINMGEQTSLQDSDVISFGYTLRSGIGGSGNSSIFNFLWNLYIVFIVAEQFTFQPTVHKGFLFLTSSSNLSLVFLKTAILTSVR